MVLDNSTGLAAYLAVIWCMSMMYPIHFDRVNVIVQLIFLDMEHLAIGLL